MSSSRRELSREKLIELAKQTLGLVPTARDALPTGYLDELRKHVKFSKNDTQFRVFPEPGYGYGTIRCLELGCEDIYLVLKKKSEGDGGKEEGIGSLSAYRVHVQEHPTHKGSRFTRVKAEGGSQSSSRTNSAKSSPRPVAPSTSSAPVLFSHKRVRANLLITPDGSSNGSASSSSAPVSRPQPMSIANANANAYSRPLPAIKAAPYSRPPPAIKPEPYESSATSSSPHPSSSPMIPRKRYSLAEDTDVTTPSPANSSPLAYKRAKVEGLEAPLGDRKVGPVPVALGTVNPNSPRPSGSGSDIHPSTSLTPNAARALLVETKDHIATTETVLAHYRKKTRKTMHDKKRIAELEKQLRDHNATKARCEVTLQLSAATAGPSNSVAQPVFGVGIKPFGADIKPFAPPPFPSGSNAYLPSGSNAYLPSGSTAYLPPTVPPVASGSNFQLPAAAPIIGGVPNALPHLDINLPVVGLPNYGDVAMDYSSDEDYSAHFRNKVAYRGPVADPGDIDKFLIEAGNSESFDGNESVDNALAKLGLKKLGEMLPLMTIALMPHQVIGVAWMLQHETGSHKGGILADEMGLGKTVQMIATMVQHRSDDPAVKSTLICAPVALLDQWKLEIETKTQGAFKCLIYHGPNKPKLQKDLQKYDVVLTTFQTLALEWPDGRLAEKKKKRKAKAKGGSDDFIESDSGNEKKAKKKGLLLRMSWFRVVLDEAQNIRNRNTRISLAVTNLDAIYRWCLTGTPVTNSLADCYGLLRFLEIRPWYDWADFNSHIARIEKKRPDLASSRLQAILNACLIRRKKDSVLDGKKLIELPPKDVVLTQLTFSDEERDIYNAIEKQSQATFNKYLRAGTVLKNYAHVLVLLLRLRQLCSHPCLIQEGGDAFIRPGEDATVKHEVQTELDRATILAGKEFVVKMKSKFKTVVLERMAAEKASADATIEEEECPICFDSLTNPVVTRCGHVFCADCIDTVLNQPAVEDGNEPRYAMSERPCPTCREPIQKEMLFQRSAFEPRDSDLENPDESSPIVVDSDSDDGLPIGSDVLPAAKKEKTTTKAKGKGKAKAKKRFSKPLLESDEDDEDDEDDDDDDISDFIVESDEDEEEKDARRELKKKLGKKNKRVVPVSDDDDMDDEIELLPPKAVIKRKFKGKTMQRFLPSTKMKEMMILLKSWAESEESKLEKTMVLSQWTSCLDLVADYLDENGFTFVRYQGTMSRGNRDEAVRTFMAQGKARIMLMSLKCGGVGLNLTRANRVISLDLGWSTAVESQAFDRVHRLGQTRPVTVQRLVIENTVEARILALQERKQNLADGSLGEGSGKKLGRLSVKDLANLFGLSVRGQEL